MGGHGQTSWFFMRARLRKSVTKGPGENFDDRRSIQKKPVGKEAREVFTRAEPRSDAQSLSHVLLGKSISVSGFQSAKHAHYVSCRRILPWYRALSPSGQRRPHS